MTRYGMTRTIEAQFDEVKNQIVHALKTQGFGIMSEINVQHALKEKINKDIERYEILGACNPHLAAHALETDRTIGLLLPCNVVLREVSNTTEVSIIDPEVMLEVVDANTRLEFGNLPKKAKTLLKNALEALERIQEKEENFSF